MNTIMTLMNDCIDHFEPSDWASPPKIMESEDWEFLEKGFSLCNTEAERRQCVADFTRRVKDLPFVLDFTDANSITKAYAAAPHDPIWGKILPYIKL